MASLKAQKALAPKYMTGDGDGFFECDKIALGASPGVGTPAAADTIDFRIPGGAQLADLAFFLDDCDTGTTFVFGIGYRAVDPASTLAASTTYFAAAGQTIGQTGGRLQCAFKPIKFEEDVYIQLLVGTAPTGLSGNPEIHLIAGYSSVGIK